MHHIEEHILELYVLNADKVSRQREEIEAHLAECHGCRLLAEQMTASYRDVEERFKQLSERTDSSTQTLTRSRRGPARVSTSDAPPVPAYRPVTRGQQIAYFVRRHPVMVGGGSFVMLAGLALLGTLVLKPMGTTDDNPTTVHMSETGSLLEVYNRSYEKLWALPLRDLEGVKTAEQESGVRWSEVADLDGDGRNEVLTVVPLADSELGKAGALSIFSLSKKLLKTVLFEEHVQFKTRLYQSNFLPRALVVDDFTALGKKEIVAVIHNGRSPNAVIRLSAEGEILGEYWHFGQILGLYILDLEGNGRKQIVICGQNDVADTAKGSFPMVAILDPSKIVGKLESAATPGFGFSPSSCEIYYIRFPLTEMNRTLNCDAAIQKMIYNPSADSSMISFWYSSGTENRMPAFEYLFSKDMQAIAAKSTNETDRLYERLRQEGRIQGTLDKHYLDGLKNGVRYWDGMEWRKEAVKVQHQTVAMK